MEDLFTSPSIEPITDSIETPQIDILWVKEVEWVLLNKEGKEVKTGSIIVSKDTVLPVDTTIY